MKTNIICLIVILILHPYVVIGCPTALENWKFTGDEYVLIPDITSVNMCEDACRKNRSCSGYTFQESDIVNFCYLFTDLPSTLFPCEGCNSGSIIRIESGKVTIYKLRIHVFLIYMYNRATPQV